MGEFLTALAPAIMIVALGRLIAWRGWVAAEGWRGIETLSYYVLFPALIVRALASADFNGAPWRIAAALIAAQFCLGAVGWALARGPAAGAIIQSNVRWNTFVALSLAGGLYGAEGLALMAVAAAAMIPTANLLSVAALTRFSGRQERTARPLAWEVLRNPLIAACALGGALNATGLAPAGPADRLLETLGAATIALGLLTAGAGVDLSALRRAGRRTLAWSLVRLLLLPAIAIASAAALDLGGADLAIVAIAAATPTATNGYILARQLGGDAPLAANLIAVQTVLAAVSMPLVFGFALRAGA